MSVTLVTAVLLLLSGTALAQSNTVRYVYDELGRLTAVIDPTGEAAIYNYDPVGNLLSITRGSAATAVKIVYFSPQTAPIGTSVVISGTGFSAVPSENVVSFNGTSATVASATSTQLITQVPAGATNGLITVTTPSGSATSTVPFTIVPSSAPSIVGFSPTIGVAGTSVTIDGNNFDPALANDLLFFYQNKPADVSGATSTVLTTTVPTDARSGRLTVRTPTGTAVSSMDFFVPPAPYAATDVAYADRMTIGETKTVPLTTPNKIGLLLFDGTAGQAVSASMAITSGTFGYQWWLKILKPDGSLLGSVPIAGGTSVFLDTLTLPTTGTYTLLVDPDGTLTGTVNVTLYGITHVTGPITNDGTPVTVPLTTPGQNGRLTFSGTAGQMVSASITLTSGTFGYRWVLYILKPDGSQLGSVPVAGPSSVFLDTLTLPAAGTYTLLIDPEGPLTGTVNAALFAVTHVTGPITNDGTPVTVPLTTPGQNGRLTFTGTAGQTVSASMTLTSGTFGYRWVLYILKPDGSQLGSVPVAGPSSVFLDTLTLPTTGTYTLLIDPEGPLTGTVNAALFAVTHVTGPITNDGTPVTVPLTTPGQNGRLTFSGTAGQMVSASMTLTSGTFGYRWVLYILKPDGSQLGSVPVAGPSSIFLDTLTLPTTGTYTLLIDPEGPLTGTVNAALFGVTHVTGPITNDGTPVTVPLSTPGQNGRLTFSGTGGQTVSASITLTSGTFGYLWYLQILKPDGSVLGSVAVSSGTTVSLGMQTLPTTGTYTLLIDPGGTLTGTVSAVLTTP